MRKANLIRVLIFIASIVFSITANALQENNNVIIPLLQQPGFYRVTYETISMPANNKPMGLVGINYFADVNKWLYGGIGSYGAVAGSQGGLFTLGLGGGVHAPLTTNLNADLGLYVGGGGGGASLVGGGLLVKPYLGFSYLWNRYRFGLFYSYVDFTSGKIQSHQVGVSVDFLNNFYYVDARHANRQVCDLRDLLFPTCKYLSWYREDFSIVVQGYSQLPGTKDLAGESQTGTIRLIGAELDHYLTENAFAWIRADGAFGGTHNGYMDVLGGLGYKWPLFHRHDFAIVAQAGLGAGGGGRVDTGGGFLVQPQLGLEFPIYSKVGGRLRAGYMWAPDGNFSAISATADLIYHIDLATLESHPVAQYRQPPFTINAWRATIFNQTYICPQRSSSDINSAVNLFAVQLDQVFTPHFFMSYQAASAYGGNQVGGYATGMIGPGWQWVLGNRQELKPFATFLIGAAGGGDLAVGGGAVFEPVIGAQYRINSSVGLLGSVGQIIAMHGGLNTPVINLGMTVDFGLLG